MISTSVRMLKAAWPLISLALIVIGIALVASIAPITIQRRVAEAFVTLVAVVGLYIFVGNSGFLSFGNVSFMAIGAYVSAILTMRPAAKTMFLPGLPEIIKTSQWSVIPAALAGGLAAALIGFLVGIPLMRLSGIAASIATFALLSITRIGIGNWDSVTGGQNSLMGLPIYTTVWVGLGWALLAMASAFFYQETRSGLILRATREDEVAARAVGSNIYRHRMIAFVISAFFSAIAGVLLGHYLGVVRIETFYLDLTFNVVAILVIGGTGSLAGAVFGTIAIATMSELLRQIEVGFQIGAFHVGAPAGLADVVVALGMLLIILFRPKGITNGRELSWPWRGAEAAATDDDDVEKENAPLPSKRSSPEVFKPGNLVRNAVSHNAKEQST
jgi:branched-chain amino acid transport system permease protein